MISSLVLLYDHYTNVIIMMICALLLLCHYNDDWMIIPNVDSFRIITTTNIGYSVTKCNNNQQMNIVRMDYMRIIQQQQQQPNFHQGQRRIYQQQRMHAISNDDVDLSSSSSSLVSPNEYLDRAAKLRMEIQELETFMNQTSNNKRRRPNDTILQKTSSNNNIQYTNINDSIWTISYRFTIEPDDDIANTNNYKINTIDNTKQRSASSLSGQMMVKFRKDGYTDLVSQQQSSYSNNIMIGTASSTTTNMIQNVTITKVWGWDIEVSNDNHNNNHNDVEYILFSVDFNFVSLKQQDDTFNKHHHHHYTERYYFQAQKVMDPQKQNTISFQDGTVTVKRDIIPQNNRNNNIQSSTNKKWYQRFFLLSSSSPAAGILAQFRFVGNFIMKPTTIES